MSTLAMRHEDGMRAPASTFRIHQARRDDEAALRALWAAYLEFSGVELPSSVTEATFERIVTPGSGMKAIVVEGQSGTLLAFAVYILHPYSFGEGDACLIDDMYVHPDACGIGIAKALISYLIARGEAAGWSKVYWVADESNFVARNLFDKHFTPSDGFVRYTMKLRGGCSAYEFRSTRSDPAHPEERITP